MVTPEIRDAHGRFLAKRKLTLILCSKAVKDIPINVDDLVQIFIKRRNEKRGKRSDSKPVLSNEHPSHTVTIQYVNWPF